MSEPPDSRIPSLDGLRAVAVLAVLAAHLTGSIHYPRLFGIQIRNPGYALGALGVRVFFVISGFLITDLLERERQRGRVHLGKFYLRRTLRIVPAYVAYLGVVALLTGAGVLHLTGADFAHALTYTTNYSRTASWQVWHLWSLSVEEQFYLLWPLTIAFAGPRAMRVIAAGVIVAAPAARVAEAILLPEWRPLLVGHTFETAADALAVGCLLALVRPELWSMRWYQRTLSSWWPTIVLLAAGIAAMTSKRSAVEWVVGMPVTNVAIAMGLDRAVRNAGGVVGRLLNSAVLVYVGTLSYSIYLWQQLFLVPRDEQTFGWTAAALGGVAVASCVSYYAIERPFRALRRRAAVLPGDRREIDHG